VGLKLRVGRRCVAAAVADVRSLAGMSTLMVVFCLVRGEGFIAAVVATSVRSIASVAEEVARKLGALLEVLRRGLAALPLAQAVSAVVDVGSFDMLVEGFWTVEEGEAEEALSVLPVVS
jgi:hypothetical protein